MIDFFGAIQFNNIISQPDNTSVYLAVLRTSLIEKKLKKNFTIYRDKTWYKILLQCVLGKNVTHDH